MFQICGKKSKFLNSNSVSEISFISLFIEQIFVKIEALLNFRSKLDLEGILIGILGNIFSLVQLSFNTY